MHPAIHLLDVAHPPRSAEAVEEELLRAWEEVRHSPTWRVIKVVHGYGSTGRGGTGKEVVRNWAFRNRTRMRGTIDGEQYGYSNAPTQGLLKEIGSLGDPDLDAGNRGITLLWVR
jgi:hypothetical protein